MGTFDKLRARYVEGASGDLTLAAALCARGLMRGDPALFLADGAALMLENAVRAAEEIFPEADGTRMRQIVDVITETTRVAG